MILDVHIGKSDTKQSCRYHRADEGCAVTANDHCNSDRECLNSEGSTDCDHDRKHSIEIGIGIKAKCKRNGKDTNHKR